MNKFLLTSISLLILIIGIGCAAAVDLDSVIDDSCVQLGPHDHVFVASAQTSPAEDQKIFAADGTSPKDQKLDSRTPSRNLAADGTSPKDQKLDSNKREPAPKKLDSNKREPAPKKFDSRTPSRNLAADGTSPKDKKLASDNSCETFGPHEDRKAYTSNKDIDRLYKEPDRQLYTEDIKRLYTDDII